MQPLTKPALSPIILAKTNGSGQRRLESWIGAFLEYTEHLEAPPIWRQWAAISTIASVLQRKVWVRTSKGDLNPNLYTVLVGFAGTGKSVTISAAEVFLRELEEMTKPQGVHIAPTSMTMASMVDCLVESKCSLVRPGQVPPVVEFNSLAILADELSALIHQYDKEFMAGLTKIFDGGIYAQYRRGKDLRIKVEQPQLNILAGTTPSNLCQFMPEGAWEQGFASRIIMVYSGDRSLADIFADRDAIAGRDVGYNNLLSDLHSIYALYGRMKIDDDAIEAFRAWRDGGEKPSPTHPKLTHYCSRRTSHIIKLCMVASAARGADMRISLGDFHVARNWLLGAELSMPDIFKAGVTSNDSKTMEETWHYVWANFAKNKKPILENKIIQFVSMRMPAHSVLRTIEIMERDGTLKSKFDVKAGCKTYEPGPRRVDL